MTNIISSDGSLQIVKLSGCDFDIKSLPSGNPSSVFTQVSPTISLAGSGTLTAKLIADVKISDNPDNKLEIDSTGLLVLPQNIDSTDEFVKVNSGDTSGHLFDKLEAGTNIGLTVVGTTNKKVRVSFTGALTPLITVADTSTISLSGDGGVGTPVIANVKISSIEGNKLLVDSSGLYVPPINLAVNDTPTIDLDLVGNALTATTKVSLESGNKLSIKSDGLYAAASDSIDEHKVKVNSIGNADYLSNQIIAGVDPEGIVTLTFTIVNNTLLVTPSININTLCTKLQEAGCLCTTPSEVTAIIN